MFIIVHICLFTQCDKIHPEDPIDIPDQTFLTALIDERVDANGDGSISYEEAGCINLINVEYRDISNLTGIEAFINPDTLICEGNQLANLDISYNSALNFILLGFRTLLTTNKTTILTPH